MSSSDKQRLLTETLEDANYQEWRANVFHVGLRELQANRPRTAVSLWAIAASVLLVASLVGVWRLAQYPTTRPEADGRNPLLISSRPTPPELIVRSHGANAMIVETRTGGPKADIVQTQPTGVVEINDHDLWQAMGGTPVAIVRHGQQATVVLLGRN